MKKQQAGFTLIEVLISLAISSMIILTISVFSSNLTDLFRKATTMLENDRRIIIFFRQFEHDLQNSIVETRVVPEQDEQDDDKKTEKKTTATTPEQKREKKNNRFFLAQPDPKGIEYIGKQAYERFKYITAIGTYPLNIYGRPQAQIVRYAYKLVRSPLEPPHQKIESYSLYRKESTDLNNTLIDNSAQKDPADDDWILILDHVKNLFIKYEHEIIPEESKGENERSEATSKPRAKTGEKLMPSFQWTPKNVLESTKKQKLPFYATLILHTWDHTYKKSKSWTVTLPFFTHTGTIRTTQGNKPAPAKKDDNADQEKPEIKETIIGPASPLALPAMPGEKTPTAPENKDSPFDKETEDALNSMAESLMNNLPDLPGF
jgi:prepilin-type N-terminal cleavage/methylation domain-containing protein